MATCSAFGLLKIDQLTDLAIPYSRKLVIHYEFCQSLSHVAYTITAAAPFDFTAFFILVILNRAAPFLQPGCF